jgi:hypothetical protein
MELNMSTRKNHILYSLFIFFITMIMPPAYAANSVMPSEVARLSFANGAISLLPAGEKKWVQTTINNPIVIGDRLWAGDKSFLELQLGTVTLRMGNKTSVKFLNLNQKIIQLQLSSGTLIARVIRLKPKQTIEISTENLAFSIKKPGYYRVFVDNNAKITVVSVLEGKGTVYGSKKAYQINAGKSCPFGINLKIYRCTPIPKPDELELWSRSRDRVGKSSAKYVSPEMIGFDDLDRHGRWEITQKYGPVWTPSIVDSNWAPYRTGHWVWIRGWGWTWVDDQPWGFAPFHYGRWLYFESRWSWVPGPRTIQPVYAPALVVFIGGRNFNLRLGRGNPGIAWFPLAPGEIYIPPRHFSREYFINVNRSNTRVGNTYITTIYNNRNTNIIYQNIQVKNGISAIPTQTFIQSRPVNQALVPVSAETIIHAPKTPVAPVVPDNASVLGGGKAAPSQPPAELLNQPAVVTVTPPAPPAPFSEEQKLLEKNPGVPLSTQENEQLKPSKEEHDTKLDVVNPEQPVTPINKELMEQAPAMPNLLQDQQAPEIQPQQPEVQPTQPEIQPTQPEVQPKQPEIQPTQPEVQPTQPETQPTQPETQPTQPEVQPTQPEVQPTQPETQPTQPEVQPTQPETQPTQPETQPTQPEIQPTQPETQPTQPETQPTQPEIQPTQPEVQPTQPEIQPTQPEIQQQQPETQPQQPEIQPTQPEIQQQQPETQPQQPEIQQQQPEIQQQQPEIQPQQPEIQQQQPEIQQQQPQIQQQQLEIQQQQPEIQQQQPQIQQQQPEVQPQPVIQQPQIQQPEVQPQPVIQQPQIQQPEVQPQPAIQQPQAQPPLEIQQKLNE